MSVLLIVQTQLPTSPGCFKCKLRHYKHNGHREIEVLFFCTWPLLPWICQPYLQPHHCHTIYFWKVFSCQRNLIKTIKFPNPLAFPEITHVTSVITDISRRRSDIFPVCSHYWIKSEFQNINPFYHMSTTWLERYFKTSVYFKTFKSFSALMATKSKPCLAWHQWVWEDIPVLPLAVVPHSIVSMFF